MAATSNQTVAWDSLPRLSPFFNPSHWVGDLREKADTKPSRYLVAKGLPTLPMKLVDRVWNLEYNDMVESLYQSLCLAEQGKLALSLQESLVEAFKSVTGNPESKDTATSPGHHNMDEVLGFIHYCES